MREQLLLGITFAVMAVGWLLDDWLKGKGKERTMLIPSMLGLWFFLLFVTSYIPVK